MIRLTNSYWKRLPLTRIKLMIATLIYTILSLFLNRSASHTVRQHIRYDLDLREGIDLHVFIFGHFQQHIVKSSLIDIPENALILDIGANIGTMSLMFAKHYDKCNIIAVEPSDITYKKLLRNLSLNPDISKRIQPIQTFVSEKSGQTAPDAIYSSWAIGTKPKFRHRLHGGIKQPSSVGATISIDDLCQSHGIEQVNLIKIDTDGLEYKVLQGSENTIKTFRPGIIFEIGMYIMDDYHVSFHHYHTFFKRHRYTLHCLKSHEIIDSNTYTSIIPENYTIDIIALPENHLS